MNLILNISLSAASVTESTVRTLSVLGTCLPSASETAVAVQKFPWYLCCLRILFLLAPPTSLISLRCDWNTHAVFPVECSACSWENPRHCVVNSTRRAHVVSFTHVFVNPQQFSRIQERPHEQVSAEWVVVYYVLKFESVLQTSCAILYQVCLRVVLKPYNREFEFWWFPKLGVSAIKGYQNVNTDQGAAIISMERTN